MTSRRLQRLAMAPTALAAVLVLVAPIGGQVMTRTATTLAAILRYPLFFHSKSVTLVGTPSDVAGTYRLPVEAPKTFVVAPTTGQPSERRLELRGMLFDVGRFASDDSRLGPLNLLPIITSVAGDRWPARETLFILGGASWNDVSDRPDATLRNVSMLPEAFEGKTVTVRGRFRGRNLYGDMPAWPRKSQWDFVIQSADAAIWVTGMRARGKGFDFDTATRASANKWLQVTGIVGIEADLPFISAQGLALSAAQSEPTDAPAPPGPPPPPPTVIFSAPTDGETDIARAAPVRIQFSRDIRAATIAPNVRVTYADATAGKPPAFTATYRPATLSVEIRFAEPLAPQTRVTIELGAGILASDGTALSPVRISFTTSGTQPGLDR